MPSIPAFCDTCGTAFPSGLFFEKALKVTLYGNVSGPCPSCGGMGHVPDGVFNFIDNTIEILSAPQRTVEELTRLVQIIHEAKAKQQSNEQVVAQIREELPEGYPRWQISCRRIEGNFMAFLAWYLPLSRCLPSLHNRLKT